MKTPGASCDAWFYLLAALCGICAGSADVAVDDLLFTALLVVLACMLLGMLLLVLAVALGFDGRRFHSAD